MAELLCSEVMFPSRSSEFKGAIIWDQMRDVLNRREGQRDIVDPVPSENGETDMILFTLAKAILATHACCFKVDSLYQRDGGGLSRILNFGDHLSPRPRAHDDKRVAHCPIDDPRPASDSDQWRPPAGEKALKEALSAFIWEITLEDCEDERVLANLIFGKDGVLAILEMPWFPKQSERCYMEYSSNLVCIAVILFWGTGLTLAQRRLVGMIDLRKSYVQNLLHREGATKKLQAVQVQIRQMGASNAFGLEFAIADFDEIISMVAMSPVGIPTPKRNINPAVITPIGEEDQGNMQDTVVASSCLPAISYPRSPVSASFPVVQD